MNENDLRAALRAVEPVILEDHMIKTAMAAAENRRRKRWLVAVTGVVIALLVGAGTWRALDPNRVAIPDPRATVATTATSAPSAPAPSTSAPSTASTSAPAPSASAPASIPPYAGDLTKLPASYGSTSVRLPKGTTTTGGPSELGTWTAADHPILICPAALPQGNRVASLAGLVSARTMTQTGIEYLAVQSALEFRDEEAAIAFLRDLAAIQKGCTDKLATATTSGYRGGTRPLPAGVTATEGFVVGYQATVLVGSTQQGSVGGMAYVVARQGRSVAIVARGEAASMALTPTSVDADLARTVTAILVER